MSMKNYQDIYNAIKANYGVIKESEFGFMASIPDSVYREIKADSKSHLVHALKTLKDYSFQVLEEHPRKVSKVFEDGTLLHTLTIEQSAFDNRYFVTPDYDVLNKDNNFYFPTKSSVSEFIKTHNDSYDYLKSLIDTAVTTANESSLDLTDFSKLPNKVKAELPKVKRDAQVMIRAFLKNTQLLTIDSETLDADIQAVIALLDNYLPARTKVNYPKNLKEKAIVLNSELAAFINKVKEASFEEQVNLVLRSDDCVSEANQAKALKTFNGQQKIDLKLSLAEKINQLVILDVNLNEKITKANSAIYKRISGITPKFTIDDALQAISELYNQKVIFKPELEASDSKSAGSRMRISQDVYDHAKRIVDTLYNHPLTNNILKKKLSVEVAMVWIDSKTGRLQKAKLDIADLDVHEIYDLKFQSTTDGNKINRDFGEYAYHLQHAQYATGYELIVGVKPRFKYLITQKDGNLGDKEIHKPIRVTVGEYYSCTGNNADINRASELLDMARDLVQTAEKENYYPCHQEPQDLEVPRYQAMREEDMLRQWRESKRADVITEKNDMADDDVLMAFGVDVSDDKNHLTPIQADDIFTKVGAH